MAGADINIGKYCGWCVFLEKKKKKLPKSIVRERVKKEGSTRDFSNPSPETDAFIACLRDPSSFFNFKRGSRSALSMNYARRGAAACSEEEKM